MSVKIREEEEEEFEVDAASLKPAFAKYLETLRAACKDNNDDHTEMNRIYTQLIADRTVLVNLEAKLANHISYLSNLNAAKNEAAAIFVEQLRVRNNE